MEGNRITLHEAARTGDENEVKRLLEIGADPSAKNNKGWTALHVAVKRGDVTLAKLLVQSMDDITSKEDNGFSAMSLAIGKNDPSMVKILLEKDLNAALDVADGMPALSFAALLNLKDVTQVLLQFEINVGEKDQFGWTALHRAAGHGKNEEVAQLLLKNGADIEARTEKLSTPLHCAADEGTENVASFLIRHGADMEAKDGQGYTALHRSADSGNENVSLLILRQGANINARDGHGATPLHRAAGRGDQTMVKILLNEWADVTARDKNGLTPLLVAAAGDSKAVVEMLLGNSDNIDACDDRNGRTALHVAAIYGKGDIVQLLLESGADPLFQDKDGYYALHYAVSEGYGQSTKLLLAATSSKARMNIVPKTMDESTANSAERPLSGVPLDLGELKISSGSSNQADISVPDPKSPAICSHNAAPELNSTKDSAKPIEFPQWITAALAEITNLKEAKESSDPGGWTDDGFPPLRKVPNQLDETGMNNPERLAQFRLAKIAEAFFKDGTQFSPVLKTSAKLCSGCASLNLTALDFLSPLRQQKTQPPREVAEKLFEKTFKDLENEKACALCQLIHYAVERTCREERIYPEHLKCLVSMHKLSCYWDKKKQFESFRFLQVTWDDPPGVALRASVDLVPVESELFPDVFVGRLVDPVSVSPRMIQRWLKQCELLHWKSCSRLEMPDGRKERSSPLWDEAKFHELRPKLFVIDVLDGCLTRLPSGGQYLALSYVWGTPSVLCTKLENLEAHKVPGTLTQSNDQIVMVIKDAMKLTADIGQRYLWVDSLCIVQDGLEKIDTINQMDLVYRNSLVTIVAATGDHANVGLPGVRSHTRATEQRCADISAHLKLIVPHSLRVVENTTWAQRAWTYQEYFFAPRRLIFVNGQVVFKCCSDSPCREDLLSEYQIFGINDYTYKLPTCNLAEMYEVKMLRSNPAVAAKLLPEMIQHYSKRQLTDKNDILNAFAGITNMLLDQCGMELCYGLIKSALCPQMVNPSPRFLTRRAGFPSWSWVGWEGEAWLFPLTSWYTDQTEWIAKHSWIDWYIFVERGDGIGEFHLIPQSKWNAGTMFGEGTSANQSEVEWRKEIITLNGSEKYIDNLELLNMHLRLAAAASEGRDVNSEAQALDSYLGDTGRVKDSILHAAGSKHGTPLTSNSEIQAFDGVPKYLDFIKKISPSTKLGAKDPNPPTTVAREDIMGLSPNTIIPKYAFLFQTVASIVWMSVYSPDNSVQENANHVYLYNGGPDKYIGVAWLCSQKLRTHVGLFPTGLPTHMVVLSGPERQESLARAWGVLPSERFEGGQGERLYRVMILGMQDPVSNKVLGEGVREKVGVGEVLADEMERMGPNDLWWDQVLLQ